MEMRPQDTTTARTPWFRRHPRLAAVLAAVLFGAVFVARWLVDGNGEAVTVFYALPIALLAMAFGVRGGLASAAGGFVLFTVFELAHGGGDIDALGWIARAAMMVLLGFLVGRAADQIEVSQRLALAQQERHRRLQESARRQAEAAELSDSILQHLAAAKWMLEAGRNDAALDILVETLAAGQRMLAELLPARVGELAVELVDEAAPERS